MKRLGYLHTNTAAANSGGSCLRSDQATRDLLLKTRDRMRGRGEFPAPEDVQCARDPDPAQAHCVTYRCGDDIVLSSVRLHHRCQSPAFMAAGEVDPRKD